MRSAFAPIHKKGQCGILSRLIFSLLEKKSPHKHILKESLLTKILVFDICKIYLYGEFEILDSSS